MKIGIMQPYFFPYIGYWQLMNQVDKYVIYDDVNFIKGGWINRNRILVGGKANYINVPLKGASSFKLINEIEVDNNEVLIKKNLRMLENAYKKAPQYNEIMPILEDILCVRENNLAKYLIYLNKKIAKYLNINTDIIISSQIEKDNELRGEKKVIEICKKLGGDEYYNAYGGKELYSKENFADAGLKLRFLKCNDIKYEQYKNDFIGNLSIIDVMMFNSKDDTINMLNKFELE